MKNIYEYFNFPSIKEIKSINKDIEKIRIKVKYKIQNEIAFGDELDYYDNVIPWINEFNFTMLNIEIPYIYVKHYYNKNIPEYMESQYNTQKYEDIDYINKYYFNYFSRIFLFELQNNFERTFHIINNVYGFGKNYYDRHLISEVMKCLKYKDTKLYNYIIEVNKNEIYKELVSLRNQLTHSFSPLNTKMITEYYNNGLITYGEKKSKSSSEIIEVIDKSLNLLNEYVIFLQNHIEKYYINKFNRK